MESISTLSDAWPPEAFEACPVARTDGGPISRGATGATGAASPTGPGALRDPAAFAELYRRHANAVLRFVHVRVGDPHTAEDLAADVFAQAFAAVGGFRWRGVPFRAWLLKIAAHRVYRWSRRERRRLARQLEAEPAASTPEPGASEALAERTRLAVCALPKGQQLAISLHYFEGLAIDEIATALGCRPGTIKSRLARGRDALRRLLQTETAPGGDAR